jgi:hypothetical protein
VKGAIVTHPSLVWNGSRLPLLGHRDADVLADAAIARRMQRTDDAERRGHTADLVSQRHFDGGGPALLAALQEGHPGETLDDGIIGGCVGRMSFGTEAANRAVNNLGIETPDVGVANAEAVGDAGAIILDHRIGFDREAAHQIAAVLLLQIDDNAALVAIEIQKSCGDPAFGRTPELPAGIALRRLDLDDIGAEVAELHRAKGSRDDLGQVQNAKACERSFSHLYVPRARSI